uniref:Late embryogenesis abundant protein LEA-2 subgroup domain-containing protein n=1 Tax=Leersia perrieri TaxID=77586 RepID=A0A0D9V698_9ORYZ
MAHGEEDLDLEAAAAAPYHAVKGDPREHDESASGRRRCPQPCLLWTLGLLSLTMLLSTFAFFSNTAATPTLGLGRRYHDHDAFSVRIAGYESINPGRPGAAVSPSFTVALRKMNGACVDRAAVTVLYSGVALGWARVEPRDCVAPRQEPLRRELEVVARGQGVGLSERLRRRMASEWRSSGALELDVDVKMFDEVTSPGYAVRDIPDRLIFCKGRMTDGQGSDSSDCPWFELL